MRFIEEKRSITERRDELLERIKRLESARRALSNFAEASVDEEGEVEKVQGGWVERVGGRLEGCLFVRGLGHFRDFCIGEMALFGEDWGDPWRASPAFPHD